MDRKALLAKVHMARAKACVCPECGRIHFTTVCPQCGSTAWSPMDDWTYRQIVSSLTGEDSCRSADIDGLASVAKAFDDLGYSKAFPYVSPERELRQQRMKVLHAILARAPTMLGDDWKARIDGFVKKRIGKDRLEFLDDVELRKVAGWMNRTAKKERKG